MLYYFSAYYRVEGKKRGRRRDVHVEHDSLSEAYRQAIKAAVQTTQSDELLVSLVHIVKEDK